MNKFSLFQFGDRVRVYDRAESYCAELIEVGNDRGRDYLKVKRQVGDMVNLNIVHPKQCRKLKPKPEPVKKEARRAHLSINQSDVLVGAQLLPATRASIGHFYTDNDLVEFREVLKGEAVVTRESLEKAWDYLGWRAETIGFEKVCKALGLTP